MERRLTLISDPTDEFPQNNNNSFKVRIPDGLRLEGKGWYVALLSLTLPNSDSQSGSLHFGHNTLVVRMEYQVLHLTGPVHQPRNDYTLYDASRQIIAKEVSNATNGVTFWNKAIQALNQNVLSQAYRIRKQAVDKDDPTPVVYVKESMCPSFRWEGEDLVLQRRGCGSTNGSVTNNAIYSCFDMAYEVALQWGFVRVDSNGKVVAGPNLRVSLFLDEITTQDPSRRQTLGVTGLKTLNGPALQTRLNLDIPRLPRVRASGASVYDLLWYYTNGNEKWVRLTGYAEWRLTNLNATYDTIHKHSGKTVMVYSDLQQSTIVGKTKAQLLRQLVVRPGGDAGHTYSEPKHLEWIPVSTRQTDLVEVQLADVNGTLLTLPKGKSLVTVALKQMV